MMNRVALALALGLVLVGAVQATAQPAASNFTGRVVVTDPFRGTGGSRLGGATVTFDPGARTHWHSHPLGQLLVITGGRGWMQEDGGAVRHLEPGDVVWTPPGVRHWHGATRQTGMVHVAVAETLDGSAVTWFEPVSEAAFHAPD